MSEPWKPAPQPPCTEPCCTGELFAGLGTNTTAYRDDPGLRTCGVTGCGHCPPVTDPALRQWITDTDPAPAEYPGDRLYYGRHLA
ncbi:hypothetical protein [Glycomyces sp. NPDC048151]|uniref:hypothetical protein n=1 Tax=Glycomyces sp. NPDC048151 TaxID=3364002 RepID=UPI003718E1AF